MSKKELETEMERLIRQQQIAKLDDDLNDTEDITKGKRKLLKANQQSSITEAADIQAVSIDDRVGYVTDDRSGDEVSDSDAEFQAIIEMDQLIKEFVENTFDSEKLQKSIMLLFEQMFKLKELIEFDNLDIKNTINDIVAKELQYFNSYSQVVKLAELAYLIQIPYKSFWQGLANIVLLNYHEMEINHVIQILYYLQKADMKEIVLDASFLTLAQQQKISKIQKYASYQLMIQYLKEQIQEVLDVSTALHDDAVYKLMLFTLDKMYIKGLLTPDQFSQGIQDLSNFLNSDLQGMTYLLQEFNFEKCIDYLRMIPDDQLSVDDFQTIMGILRNQSKKKAFYNGRKPQYSDVTLLLEKLKLLKEKNNDIDSDTWNQLMDIVRLFLQKAITNYQPYTNQTESDDSLIAKDQQFRQDLEFIQILKNQGDLQVFDQNISKVVIFEVSTQILKKVPFSSQEEAQIRLSLLLYALRSLDVSKSDLKQNKYIQEQLVPKINQQIYENEEFDKYLDYEQYSLLKNITQRLEQLVGPQKMLSQQKDYLERKMHNYIMQQII